MKKNGFTLAEVLVALGLIGVLSAMTVPTLVKNNQNQIFANSLSTAVSDFENTMSALIVKENGSNLHETTPWVDLGNTNLVGGGYNTETQQITSLDEDSKGRLNSFVNSIREVLNLESFQESSDSYYGAEINVLGSGDTEQSSTIFGGATFALVSKKGFTYHMRTISPAGQVRTDLEAMTAGVNISRIAAWVFIDVNGNERPNRTGRDIFGFILGNDGIMYPLGGRDAAFQVDNNAANTWSTDASTYTCTDTTKDSFALGCTARLIDNNYRMDY